MWKLLIGFVAVVIFCSCKTSSGVFTKKTAHDEYGDKLDKLGVRQTALGSQWFRASEQAVSGAVQIQLPYKESGYFAADSPEATGLRFSASRGEQLTIELSKIPAANYLLFADLFTFDNGTIKFIQSVDTVTNILQYVVKEHTNFIFRIQPELVKSGSYVIAIKTGPSLTFPVLSPNGKNRIISVWGAGRDMGARKHEGVDIGGSRGTPLIAAGDGYVSRVTENALGGKVVFISAANGDENWYYAHLDSQIAKPGQKVKAGDIIGLMGNTGNARTTAPHLHFGIYTSGGAVDPLPYINPVKKEPKAIIAPLSALGKQMRSSGKSLLAYQSPDLTANEKIAEHVPVQVIAATDNVYKVILPGGEIRFIPAGNIAPLEKRIKQIRLKQDANLMDAPVAGSPVIETLTAGTSVDMLGVYEQYKYVALRNKSGWIIEQ